MEGVTPLCSAPAETLVDEPSQLLSTQLARTAERSVCVCTQGCINARNMCARVEEFFRINGWKVVSTWEDASLIVLWACGVHEIETFDSVRVIRWIRREHPHKDLLVWGCIAVTDLPSLREVYRGPTFGPRDISRFNAYGDRVPIEQVEANRLVRRADRRRALPRGIRRRCMRLARVSLGLPALAYQLARAQSWMATLDTPWSHAMSGTTLVDVGRKWVHWSQRLVQESRRCFYITCASGCVGSCTFCAIRQVRGSLTSKPLAQVVAEFEEGLRKGYRHFQLLGTDLGCYGFDIGTNLVKLLQELAKSGEQYHLWLPRVNPRHLKTLVNDLDPDLMAPVSAIEAAAESGSDRILKAMGRGYSAAEFAETVRRLRALAPRAAVCSDLIVGFPGETDADFALTRRLMASTGTEVSHVMPFSPRPGTRAAGLPGRVDQRTMMRRWVRLQMDDTARLLAYWARCKLGKRNRLWRDEDDPG